MRPAFRLILSALIIGLLAVPIFARDSIQGENCRIPAETVIKGTLFVFCQNLQIEGRVTGNVIGIALRADISGKISENVYLAGLELDLNGTIARDLHYIGLLMNLNAPGTAPHRPVGGQVIFAALSAQLANSASIHGQIIGIGYQLLIDGAVQGEINYWGSAFVLNSTLSGDVYATVGNPEADASDLQALLLPLNITPELVTPGLLIHSSAAIDGSLFYHSPVEAQIAGTVSGQIIYQSTTPALLPIVPEAGVLNVFFDQFLRETTVLLTVGLLGLTLAAQPFQIPLVNLRWRPVPSFVIGMLLFILSFPITLALLLLTTIVLLILALLQLEGVLLVAASLLTLLDIGIIGIFYFTAIFVARTVFALGLGRLILHLLRHRISPRTNLLSLIIGVLAFALLASLPVLGFLFNAGALFMGLGAIASVALEWLQAVRDRGSYGAPPAAPAPLSNLPAVDSEAPALPPAPSEPPPALPPPSRLGLNNLPDGFDADAFFSDE